MSRFAFIEHLALHSETPKRDIEQRFVDGAINGHAAVTTYSDLCDELDVSPMSIETTREFEHDFDSTLKSSTPELVEALKVIIDRLKTTGKVNLQELYAEDKFADIPLYQAFDLLIENKVAEGISPYRRNAHEESIHRSQKTMEIIPGRMIDEVKAICVAKTQSAPSGLDYLDPQWDRKRKPSLVMLLPFEDPQTAAQEVFRKLNIDYPKHYKGPSFSVGDIVEVHSTNKAPVQAMCAPQGWDIKPLLAESPEIVKSMEKSSNELPTIEMMGEKCSLQFSLYQKPARTAIQVVCEDGSPMAKATVNIPGVPLKEDEVLIKNYSENEGIAEKLEAAGLGKILSKGDGIALMKITNPAALEKIGQLQKDRPSPKKQATTPEMN